MQVRRSDMSSREASEAARPPENDPAALESSPEKETAAIGGGTATRSEDGSAPNGTCSAAFDAMGDAACVLSADRMIVDCNEAMCGLVGRGRAEIIGRRCWDLLHGAPGPVEGCPMDKARRSGRSETAALEIGDRRMDVTIHPMRDGAGDVTGAIHIMSDRVAESELSRQPQESTVSCVALLQALQESILVIGPDHRIVEANQAAASLVGLDPVELIGRHCHKILHGSDQPCDLRGELCLLNEVFETGEARSFRRQWTPRQGHKTWVDVLISPVTDDRGRVTHVIEAGRDVTELVAIANALKRLTHDLNERVKELRCLNGIAEIAGRKGATTDEIAWEAVDLVVGAMQHSGVACARITLDGQEFSTEGFRETDLMISSDLEIDGEARGHLQVGYAKRPAGTDGDPFLKEERTLVAGLADLLARLFAQARAAEKVRKSEESLRALIDAAAEGILVAGIEDRTIRYANPRICEMLGYRAEELVGLTLSDLHPEEDLDRVLREFHEQARGERVLSERVPFLRNDGEIVLADVLTTPCNSDGVESSIGLITETSGRPQASDQLRHRLQYEQLVSTAATLLTGLRTDQLEDAIDQTLRATGRFLSADYCHVSITSLDSDAVVESRSWYSEHSPLNASDLNDIPWLESAWSGARLSEFRPVCIQMADQLPQQAQDLCRILSGAGVQAAVALPLTAEGRVNGVLAAFASRPHKSWTTDSVSLLSTLADLLGGAFTRRASQAALESALVRLQGITDGTVKALSSLTELRDPYTSGHQVRVAELARAIALEMGLPRERADGVHVAGMLHDIGMIHVPIEILVKPDHLDDVEYSMVRAHTQLGRSILERIDFPWPVADVAGQHHERIDGSGYPLGLTGDQICLEARIVGVADVVAAMCSHRPFRPALPVQEAMNELSWKRGVLFDADVVDAAMRLLRNDTFNFAAKKLCSRRELHV
jgi:PAS domain S-box-containing protein/putative nucleotidyltransferase with HDIG domain